MGVSASPGPPVGRARSLAVRPWGDPGVDVSFCWWAKLGPGGPEAGAHPLVGEAVPGVLLEHWCVCLSPGPSGGRGQVLGQPGAQGVLAQRVSLWVGLCLSPASSLA